MTLKGFIESRKESSEQQVFGYAAISKRHSVFSCEMEKDFADHVKTLADQFHGLSLEKCRALAYEFAVINKLTIPNNWTRDRKAGWTGGKVSRSGISYQFVRQRLWLKAAYGSTDPCNWHN